MHFNVKVTLELFTQKIWKLSPVTFDISRKTCMAVTSVKLFQLFTSPTRSRDNKKEKPRTYCPA